MNRFLSKLTLGLALLAGPCAAVALAAPQHDPDDLRRDEEEILRKSERLRDLMQTLLQRYRQEGRAQQVKLLEDGLQHLQESGLLEDVAGIRDSLQDRALTEALQRQAEVVADLEQLLAILRDRRSIESLQQEMEAAAKLTEQASELLREQTELRSETTEKTASPPTPAERAFLDQLRELAEQQRSESARNTRDAGARAEALEDALRRVQALLQQQTGLEASAQRQLEDPAGALADPARQQGFRLGELSQQLGERLEARAADRAVEQAAAAARELEEALARNDAEALRQALARLQSQLAAPDRRSEDTTTARLDEWRARLEKLGDNEERATLEEAARDIQQLGADAAGNRARESSALQALAEQIEQTARELADGAEGKESEARSQAAKAAEALRRAAQMTAAGRDGEAEEAIAEAQHALDAARREHQDAHPDARQQAAQMASETAQVAQGVRRVPAAADEPGPETEAATALEEAERALRAAADLLQPTRAEPPSGADVQREVGAARQQLETAEQQLSKALSGESAGREAEMDRAAARQRELAEKAAALQQQVGAGANGLDPEQQRATAPPLQQAQESMQKAQRALEQHQQATGGAEQARAAEALEQAMDAMRRARSLSEEQKNALAELAKRQEELEKDIIQLAREVQERKNHKAQRALEQASAAANRASQAMRDGDAEETDEQQQEAQEQLQQAAQALQEEKDRYQDLRQEELLFRMRDELQTMLEKQRPITESTREIGATIGEDRIARRVRRQLNELGTQESELASKTQYLRTALEEEASLVFSHVLNANQEDLEEVAKRLGGQHPDPGELTVMLQQDVEKRTEKLIEALKREQERRRQNQNQQQQQQDQNGSGRAALVPVLAELQMLRQMEVDLMEQTRQMQALVAGRGDAISGLETTLIERLASRHNDVTRIFLTLKAQLEQALQPNAGGAEHTGKPEEKKK
jgi:hypothetical protein